jgi:hypothetical protein
MEDLMKHGHERITLQDTTMSAVKKLVEGNPGAATVCMEALKKAEQIDPDAMLGGVGVLCSFDMLAIYGPRIWMLYKDVCKCNINHTLGLLRAHQLGFLTESALNHAIDNYGEGIDIEAMLKSVSDQLPRFQLISPDES